MKFPAFTLNVPNALSMVRVVFIPLFIYLLTLKTKEAWFWAIVVFGVASFTDLLDGWMARKLKQESEFGKFIDPLADKFLVISALVAILMLDHYLDMFRDFWMIIIIVGRDVMITIMRSLALKKGRALRTSRFGKVKTAFQMGSIVIILMIYILRNEAWVLKILASNKVWLFEAPYWIMFVMTIMTALSGFRYLYTNWRLFFPQKEEAQ